MANQLKLKPGARLVDTHQHGGVGMQVVVITSGTTQLRLPLNVQGATYPGFGKSPLHVQNANWWVSFCCF